MLTVDLMYNTVVKYSRRGDAAECQIDSKLLNKMSLEWTTIRESFGTLQQSRPFDERSRRCRRRIVSADGAGPTTWLHQSGISRQKQQNSHHGDENDQQRPARRSVINTNSGWHQGRTDRRDQTKMIAFSASVCTCVCVCVCVTAFLLDDPANVFQTRRDNNEINNKNSRQWDWHISTHANLRPHAARFHERRISSVTFSSANLYGNVYMPVGVARALVDSSDFGLLGSKAHKNGRLGRLNRFFSAEKSVTIQTHTQTVTDISTPCLSACVKAASPSCHPLQRRMDSSDLNPM